MAIRLKEEDKNEKAIRALLRKQTNRRCINCNSLGPQYVCLNFWTFVCTQCSGIHREFTHRVKSVSMSKFTSQEVANLENGGNEHARGIYFKDWDQKRQQLPDSSNVDRLRDFIKMVYVERRLSGERTHVRGANREGFVENRRSDSRPSYKGESRSPTYEDRLDDKFENERGGRNHGRNSPLPVRPVKEILGEDAPPLVIGNNRSQINGGHEKEKSHSAPQDVSGQQIRSSGILRPVEDVAAAPLPAKREEPTSLIDFGVDSESSTIKEFGASINSHSDASSNNSGWASFETFPTAALTPTVSTSLQPASGAVPAATLLATPITQGQLSANTHSQVNGNAQWIAEWSTASQTPAVQTNIDNWSSFAQSSNLADYQLSNTFQGNHGITNTVPDAQMQPTKEIPTAQIEQTLQYSPVPLESNLVPDPSILKSTRVELPEDLFVGGLQKNPQFTGYPPARPHYLQMSGTGVMVGGYNQPQLHRSINPFDLPGEFPNMSSVKAALPNLSMGPMQLFPPTSGGYGHQWHSDNSMGPGPVSYPTTGVPFNNQHIPNSTFSTMQPNRMGMPRNLLSSSVQNTESFSGASMFPNASPVASFGWYHSQVAHNGSSFQNMPTPMAPTSFQNMPTPMGPTSFQGQGILPQRQSTSSGFPLHGAQQFIAQDTFGSSGNRVLDAPFSVPSQTSLDPGGNPFS